MRRIYKAKKMTSLIRKLNVATQNFCCVKSSSKNSLPSYPRCLFPFSFVVFSLKNASNWLCNSYNCKSQIKGKNRIDLPSFTFYIKLLWNGPLRRSRSVYKKDHYNYSEAAPINNRWIILYFLNNTYIFFYKFMLHIFELLNSSEMIF